MRVHFEARDQPLSSSPPDPTLFSLPSLPLCPSPPLLSLQMCLAGWRQDFLIIMRKHS